MPKSRKNELSDAFCLAIAAGTSVGAWAKANQVAPRTCYDWAAQPGFRAEVNKHRSRLADAALAKLTGAMSLAVDTLSSIARSPDASPANPCRISACRALLRFSLDVEARHDLLARMTALENERSGQQSAMSPELAARVLAAARTKGKRA